MNLEKIIASSIGQKVVSSTSGGGVGSLWLISFENEDSFYICCAWRIEKEDKVLATSSCGIEPKVGQIIRSVRKLEGHKLLSFELSEQYDLVLFFEENYIVHVFCNQLSDDEYDFNWSYSKPSKDSSYDITENFQIHRGTYFS